MLLSGIRLTLVILASQVQRFPFDSNSVEKHPAQYIFEEIAEYQAFFPLLVYKIFSKTLFS